MSNLENKVFIKIYALLEPDESEIRYVGQTRKELEVRSYYQLEDLMNKGYDAIIENHSNAEEEVRILKADKIKVVGIE